MEKVRTLANLQIELPEQAIVEFCERWQIDEFYVFGSVLREDFRPDSDLDVMVQFKPGAPWGFEFAQIKQELEALVNRPVDLLTKKSIEQSHNWIRRQQILETAKIYYAAR